MSLPASFLLSTTDLPTPLSRVLPSFGREYTALSPGTVRCRSQRITPSLSTQPMKLRVENENIVPSRTHSLSTFTSRDGASTARGPLIRKFSVNTTHTPSWRTNLPPTLTAKPSPIHLEEAKLEVGSSLNIDEPDAPLHVGIDQREPRFSFAPGPEVVLTEGDFKNNSSHEVINSEKPHPFRRWMTTLHRKNQQRRKGFQAREDGWMLDESNVSRPTNTGSIKTCQKRKHRKSGSWSSSGFVTTVKSATASLGTLSVAQYSRKYGSAILRSNRSSAMSPRSQSNRSSWIEGSSTSGRVLDDASRDRAIKRRATLEELLSSEESYVADLKVLVNVYFTLLASAPTGSQSNLTHIHENITEILVLHEDLLSRMRHVIHSSTTRMGGVANNLLLRIPEPRRHSLDMPNNLYSITNAGRRSYEVSKFHPSQCLQCASEPEVAAEIATIFGNMMCRFFVYEEYGARYESMLHDMTLTTRAVPNWHEYERGIEALANTLAPITSRDYSNKKGLTFGDLLIKPIQRVCKYPLLFADLYKQTPVIDCPESNAEVEKALFRLRETAMEINRATNDEDTRERIQRSWHLQDLLVFADKTGAPYNLRSLGHSVLCGVLFVAYQSTRHICGEYMLCALFNSCLILALPCENSRHYRIMASISLNDLRMETTDNGKGLQCHTALFAWKILFESDQQLYELMLSSCSALEEAQWKKHLINLSAKASQSQFDGHAISPEQYSMMSLDIKSLGSILGQPGTLARRLSIQRTATVGPRTNVCQVFIKNTHALSDGVDSPPPPINHSVGRSQSLLSTNRTPVLAPKRVDRIRMEQDLVKVWTRDLLAYPGMAGNPHHLRASASSMIRKLSRASLTSGFSKRSISFASVINHRNEELQEHPDHALNLERGETGLSATFATHGGSKTGLPSIVPPQRTSSTGGVQQRAFRVLKDGEDVTEHDRSELGELGNNPLAQGKALKTRWSSPAFLFRRLSTEGMKTLFV